METSNDKNWMVLYTRSRWEKKVDLLLKDQMINSFCPLVKTNREWVDRRKIVDVPLFRSYLFVQINHREQTKVVQTSGVINFIMHGGKPAIIKDTEIDRIRTIVRDYTDVEAIPAHNINIGDHVRITDGPLFNFQGKIEKLQGRSVVMILNSIGCALTIKIDQKQLSPAPQPQSSACDDLAAASIKPRRSRI
jgi:transcription antitermination factor NusG